MTALLAFNTFAAPHLWALALTAGATLALVPAGRAAGPGPRRWIGWGLAVLLLANRLAYHLVEHREGLLDLHHSLPLDPCDLSSYLAAIALLGRWRWACELTWFWGIAGALPGLVTPDTWDFPHAGFFCFFVSHGGTVVAAFYVTFALRNPPRRRSLAMVLGVTVAWAAVTAAVDWLLGPQANYGYLRHRPETATVMDYLGPWPWYVLALGGIAAALFVLLWLPFQFAPGRGGAKENRPAA